MLNWLFGYEPLYHIYDYKIKWFCLQDHQINLAHIESRSSKRSADTYEFMVEIDNSSIGDVKAALEDLKENTKYCQVNRIFREINFKMKTEKIKRIRFLREMYSFRPFLLITKSSRILFHGFQEKSKIWISLPTELKGMETSWTLTILDLLILFIVHVASILLTLRSTTNSKYFPYSAPNLDSHFWKKILANEN